MTSEANPSRSGNHGFCRQIGAIIVAAAPDVGSFFMRAGIRGHSGLH